VVEVISPTPRDARRDRIEKRADCARVGVRWYWIVDPWGRTVEVFELDQKRRYAIVASLSAGILRVPGCGRLNLDVDKLWARLDRLPS
jgi:Uma2 family endonuclease